MNDTIEATPESVAERALADIRAVLETRTLTVYGKMREIGRILDAAERSGS